MKKSFLLDLFVESRHVCSVQNSSGSTRLGLVYIFAAKIWFLVAGFLLQFLLPRVFGSSALFGMWTVLLAWASGINNVMVTGTIQTVAHFAKEGPEGVEQAKRTALYLQLLLGTVGAVLFIVAAPLIAAFEKDATLVAPLRLAGSIIFAYSVYAVFVGAANGQRLFHKQAGLDMLYATLRTGLVLGTAWCFHTVMATVGGFVVAAYVIMAVSILYVGWPRASHAAPVSLWTMAKVLAGLMVYLFAINQTMFLDTYALKALYTRHVISALHLTQEAVKQPVDALLGFYGAALAVARVPYQLMLAVTFVIFPLLSKRNFEERPDETKSYIANTLRYSLLLIGAMIVGLGVRPLGTVQLLFPAKYAPGATALLWLLLGYGCFALFSIVGTILNSLGARMWAALAAWSTLVVMAVTVPLALWTHLPLVTDLEQVSQQPEVLHAIAQGVALGFFVGLLIFLLILWKRTSITLPVKTTGRVLVSSAVGMLVGWLWPAVGTHGFLGGKAGTILCGVAAVFVYAIVLLVLKELSVKQLKQLRKNSSNKPDHIDL